MYKLALALCLMMYSSTSLAHSFTCMSTDMALRILEGKGQDGLRIVATNKSGTTLVRLFVNKETKEWTMLVTPAKEAQNSCFFAEGLNWLEVPKVIQGSLS